MFPERVRAHGTVLGAVAVVALAVVSVAGLVVAESRLHDAFPSRSSSTSSTTTTVSVTDDAALRATANELLASINNDRITSGAASLTGDVRLARAAQHWAEHMAAERALDHQDLDPVLELGFDTAGETILAGPPGMDAAGAERAWMSSPPNRSTVLSHAFTSAGVGIATDGDGHVWITVDVAG